MAGNLAGESSREAANRQQELQRAAARGRQEAEAEAEAERQELRAELRDAQARNALAVRHALEAEAERQELLAGTERLRAELQDARREVAGSLHFAAATTAAQQRAAAAQQRAEHAFAEAEASRNALVASASAREDALVVRLQQQNSQIADLTNQDRQSWGGLQMGIAEDGGNVVLSPGAAALVHFAMPGNPCLPPSVRRPRGSSQLFPRPADTAFPYAFSAEIAWLQDEWGSPNRGRRNRFELTRIVVEDNPDVRAAFISNIARNEASRARGTNPAMLPEFGSVDAADQQVKDNVLAALQVCFLPRMGLQNENLLLVFHGASH